ncbi:PIG-L family deacetylase [Marinobacter panjinensis]|uniref:PIG-L family deacetylase n=1 Tax=Marinobacter panjinensis TaxID=2576384 RepID=A0A4U6R447_9GAMM|nr:PIG-L deacetylase family protein [Marinobacter panjinensis]MCR8913702.1 PIG-L family deacetylase [Marinobacter panjinensis]TKV67648.1 PIG-L family deacetylase [Marinobacter panjinensis]
MGKIVLVVAAHTDDEALGCGGTIARHVAQGDTVYAVFLADGVTSRPDASPEELAERNEAATKAHQILGIKKSYMVGFPDNRMDSLPLLDVVQKLEAVLAKINPSIVYTHNHTDLNIDHRITHQAVMTACRPVPGASVKEIYAFEVLSATEWNTPTGGGFIANLFVDISEHLGTKSRALEAYAFEMRKTPHSRSIENAKRLAMFRGNCVGVEAAEAFNVVRILT